MSRRIVAIEEALGARLLLRGGREFSWTSEGRAALSAAETVASTIEDTVRTVRTAKLDAVGAVRVSGSPALIPPLAPMLAATRATHPQLEIQLDRGAIDVIGQWYRNSAVL